MTSKLSQKKWEESPPTYLSSLTKDQRKKVRCWTGMEAAAYNAVQNGHDIHTHCKVCETKLTRYKGLLNGLCGSKDCMSYARGSFFRGKKRPEHSKLMKVKVKSLIDSGQLWTEEHRRNNKRHLSKLNASIDRTEHSRKLKSDEHKRKVLIRCLKKNSFLPSLWKKSVLSRLTEERISSASSSELATWHRFYNSMKTITAMRNNPDMGASDGTAFKRIRVTGLNRYYKDRRSSVTLRSSTEYLFVQWLESQDSIRWRYEWTSVETDFGYTKPDFKIYPPVGAPWVIEIKGTFFPWMDKKARGLDKILSVVAFCRLKGYKYTVLSCSDVKDPSPRKWVDLTKLNDKQVVKHLAKHIPGALDVLINRIY